MAEKERSREASAEEEKVRVVVSMLGKKLEYWVPRGTSVREIIEMVEKDLGRSLGGMMVRLNNRDLTSEELDTTIEEDALLAIFARIVGGMRR